MEKTRIDIDLILPGIPDERDDCVHRIIDLLQNKKGIEKVHIVSGNGTGKAQLCFHYHPDKISISQVEKVARIAGAEISEKFGHILFTVTGVRHPRHARMVEEELKNLPGILTVSVSGTGFIRIEYDRTRIQEKDIESSIEKEGLVLKEKVDIHEHEHAAHTEKEGHVKDTHAHEGHDHGPNWLLGKGAELILSIICGFFLALGFILSQFDSLPSYISLASYIIAYISGGYFTTKEAIEGLSNRKFDIDFLMLVAAIGAAVLGHWAEGALLLFLFSFSHALEHYAMEKARRSIAALATLTPKTALLKTGDEIREIDIEELQTEDVIVVKPNSIIAADGFVVLGSSSVNQAPITGESVPVDKEPVNNPDMDGKAADKLDARHRVFAGSINGAHALEVKVSRLAGDSTIARLVKLVNEAQTQKSGTQNFADKLEKYYVPAVLVLVSLLLFAFLVINEPFSDSFYRAMAVLVAASPCALAISTPSAVLSGVARAARGGVLIKGGRPLEDLGSLKAIAFDKTGTLTEGRPRLTGVYPLNGMPEDELLAILIAVEKLSDHPLAAAIVKGAGEKLKKDIPAASGVQAITGRGVRASHNGHQIHIGNQQLFTEKNNPLPDELKARIEEMESAGHTTMLVQKDQGFVGMITLMDVAREDAKETLQRLSKEGIRKMVMLTGDNQKVAEAIARQIGITDAWGNLLPEQKVEAIDRLRKTEKKVAMVGDGVNDAPAMAKSTVGIAMGAAGSDVALETADIALMADKLSNLPFAIGLSRKAHAIIRQNIFISLGMVVILIPLTLTGYASIGPAVIGHEGSTLLVVFNALRLLVYRK
jgi:Cd2+/Zn2+-exporting ATPase